MASWEPEPINPPINTKGTIPESYTNAFIYWVKFEGEFKGSDFDFPERPIVYLYSKPVKVGIAYFVLDEMTRRVLDVWVEEE